MFENRLAPLFAAAESAGTTPTAAPAAENIFAKAIAVQLSLSRLGTRRKVSTDAVQTDAAAELVHVSADILESEELEAIRSHDRGMQEYLRNRASGPAIFKGGVYLIAYDLVSATDDELQRRLTERAQLVETFLAVYQERRATTEAKLGTLAGRVEWPSARRVAASFEAQVRYRVFDTPASLQNIRADIYERESAKAAAEWRDAMQECRQVLRAAFADLVSHMADRLTPNEDGKRKVFRDSLIQNLDEFLLTFSARNIADDADLADLVERARGVMKGVTAKDLRDQDGLRSAVAQSMKDIKAAIDPLVIVAPSRMYSDE